MAPLKQFLGNFTAESSIEELQSQLEETKKWIKEERTAYMSCLEEELACNGEETHYLDWNITHLDEECNRLRGERGALELKIMEEANRIEVLQERIARYEAEEIEDKITIQKLLGLTQPVTNDITFVLSKPKDIKFSKELSRQIRKKDSEEIPTGFMSKRRGANLYSTEERLLILQEEAKKKNLLESTRKKDKFQIKEVSGLEGKEKRNQRTNYQSMECLAALSIDKEADSEEVQAIKKAMFKVGDDIIAHRLSYADEVIDLQAQRMLREEKSKRELKDLLDQLERRGDQLQEEEVVLEFSAVTHLNMIREAQQTRADVMKVEKSYSEGLLSLKNLLRNLKEELKGEERKIMTKNAQEIREATEAIEGQISELKAQGKTMVSQYTKLEPLWQIRVKELENLLKKERILTKREVQRYNYEIEGYTNDMKLMIQEMKNMGLDVQNQNGNVEIIDTPNESMNHNISEVEDSEYSYENDAN